MRARSFWGSLIAACWPAISIAALDPTDVIQIHGTVSLIRDNNLFRLPDLDPRLFGIDPGNKEDTVFVKGIGLKIDKLVSRQRLIADIAVNESTYDKNDQLDYVGGDGRLAWLWQVGDYWSGEAAYRKRRTLGGFGDFRQSIQDIIDTEVYTLSGGYLFHPRWRVSADISEQDSSHSAAARRSLDYNAHAIGTELRYRTPALNTAALQIRRTDRNYPNRITAGAATSDSGHRETRLNALGTWYVTGETQLNAQLGHVEVAFDTQDQRNFSGYTWRTAATWDATGKLRLSINGFKDVRLYEDVATSYIVVQGFGFSPTYSITPKILLQADFTYEKRDFRGDPGFLLITSDREDKIRLARVGLTYSPIRNIDLSLSYEVGRRRSSTQSLFIVDGALTSVKANDYDYQTWFATIRVGF